MLDPTQLSVADTGGIFTLPLFSLCLSGLNVRQTERDADIAALAEDIAARGLKQNLVVVPAHFSTADTDANFGDKFEVIAGGRRFQALQLLAETGRIAHDFPVPVMTEARDEARETSLSENLHRVAMNPADEFLAFAAIVAQAEKHGEEDPQAYCAKRFGVTKRHVAERMRLASLAPEILSALRNNHIGLDSAKAYAGSEDHELQLKVFLEQSKPNVWQPHRADGVRAALRGITLSIDDPLVIYAGLDAYRDQGGRTEVEMFMGTDGEERIVSVPLLQKMAREKAEGALAAHVKAEGWKKGLLAKGSGSYATWPKPPEGFEKTWDYINLLSELPKAERKKCIAVVAVAHDGRGLQTIGRFRPAVEKEERPAYTPMTDEERAAAVRAQAVDAWSARLALGGFDGTKFEGKAFWPQTHWLPNTVDFEFADDDEENATPISALVTVEIRVTAEEIAACREKAEAKVDEIEAAKQAERERRDADRVAKAEAEDAGDIDCDELDEEADDDAGEFDEEDAA